MDDSKKPTRERQIELMVNAERRTVAHVAAWISRPDFRAALHRYDRKKDDGGRMTPHAHEER